MRPEPGWSATAQAARDLGLEVAGKPLFHIERVDWTAPAGPFDALLVGSANAFRHGGSSLARYAHLPVYCVGEATATAARAAGFEVAAMGQGGLQTVLNAIDPPARLLRLAGEEHVELAVPDGIQIEECVVYRSVPKALHANDLPANALVALHSGVAATHFGAEIDRLGIDRGGIALIALGPRIAEQAGEGWAAIHVAPAPDDAALLAMTKSLCQ